MCHTYIRITSLSPRFSGVAGRYLIGFWIRKPLKTSCCMLVSLDSINRLFKITGASTRRRRMIKAKMVATVNIVFLVAGLLLYRGYTVGAQQGEKIHAVHVANVELPARVRMSAIANPSR